MFHVGPTELIIILVLVLAVFGPRRLPGISRGIAKGIRDLRNGLQDKDESNGALNH